MLNNKFYSFSLIMIILIISIGCVSAKDNATLQSQTEATDANPTVNEKTFDDIQTAIDNAKENDTIELEGTYISKGNNINITKSITLESSKGATLDADSQSTILDISNVSVCLKNLNFINSNSKNIAAIKSDGNLTIENCYFKDNTMSFTAEDGFDVDGEYGGTIFSRNSLNINNSTFENNIARGEKSYIRYYESEDYFDDYYDKYVPYTYAGGIWCQGTLLLANSNFINSSSYNYGKTTIINSTFKKCSGLELESNATITGCNFTKNSGGISTWGISNKIIIDNCNFVNDTLDSQDNLVIGTSYIYIFNSNFENNNRNALQSQRTFIENSTFINNKGKLSGGIEGWELFLTNCTFINNSECAVISKEKISIDGNVTTGYAVFDDSLNIIPKFIKMDVKNTAITYASGIKPQIKLTFTKSGNPVTEYIIHYSIFKENREIYADFKQTSEKGIMTLEIPKNVGEYKIKINGEGYEDPLIPKTTISLKVMKAKTIIKAPKVTAKYKKSKYFKVTVKHKTTKKAVKNTYVKIKIGKKTYNAKTNSKGIAKINTKKLKAGKYKVTISSGNTNYKMSGKSTITIKK